MQTITALLGNTAATFLTHFFGSGLADDNYVAERFKAMAAGDFRPWPGAAPATRKGRKARRVTATLKAMKEMLLVSQPVFVTPRVRADAL